MCFGMTGIVSALSLLLCCSIARFSCVPPGFKAGEAAAKKREDATKGSVRIK